MNHLSFSRTLSRWYWLFRSHRWSQLRHRACNVLQRRLPTAWHRFKGRGAVATWDAGLCPGRCLSGLIERRSSRQVSSEEPAASGSGERRVLACDPHLIVLNLLGLQRALSRPIDWRCASLDAVPHLWRFHLHYHDWLWELPAAQRWEVVRDWIQGNPLVARTELADAWHPFCLSRRIVNWCLCWAAEPPVEALDEILASLTRQTWCLSRTLEWDLRGNHLLFNLWALGIAAGCLPGQVAEQGLAIVRRYLPGQIAEQILPAGEHFERSPMYHAEMLELFEELGLALLEKDPDLAGLCLETSSRMQTFLEAILHPDGGIPLLGDSAFDGVSPTWRPRSASAAGQRRSLTSLRSQRVGDYWIFEAPRSAGGSLAGPDRRMPSTPAGTEVPGSDFLLFDVGPVAAEELPAHAHCDLLGFEASWDGQRVFVDAGVFDYADSEMRRYCRSTAAHNVLQIDEVDQCDVWSKFRMGYRGWPTSVLHGIAPHDMHWCRATHDAYRRIGVPEVGRLVACGPGGLMLLLDWAQSRDNRTHRLTSRLHLHPAVRVSAESGTGVLLSVGSRSLHVSVAGPGELTIESGWYAPRFGERHPNQVLCLRTDEVVLPAMLCWLVQCAESPRVALLLSEDSPDQVCLQRGEQVVTFAVQGGVK